MQDMMSKVLLALPREHACKDPLILTLIEYDLLNGKRPPPAAMLALAYITTLYGVNAMNTARRAENTGQNNAEQQASSKSAQEAADQLPSCSRLHF